MKSLIVVTGKETAIMSRWLPSLRKNSNYIGDILIVDYFDTPFSNKALEFIHSHKNIFYVQVTKVYDCISTDRMRAFYKLRDILVKYDTIMIIDGNDIEFFKPIQSLFDMAKKKLCYVKEYGNNEAFPFYYKMRVARNYWNRIKSEKMINAGMFVGPSKIILELLEFMTEIMTTCGAGFGSDQLSLNIFIYYHLCPSLEVGHKWNSRTWAKKLINFTETKCRIKDILENTVDVAIFHAQNDQIISLGYSIVLDDTNYSAKKYRLFL